MADVNWNLAVTPDPFKQIAEGRDYSRSIFDQAALLKAGSQYAAGDPASAANTVASRGDFKTAGDLSTLATRRQAGQLYAGGDAAGAGKALAGGGDFETAGKLQEQQIKTIEAQQNALGKVGGFLEASGGAPDAWDWAARSLQAVGVQPDTITKLQQQYATNPKQTIAQMKALADHKFTYQTSGGVTTQWDERGNLVQTVGESTAAPHVQNIIQGDQEQTSQWNPQTKQWDTLGSPGPRYRPVTVGEPGSGVGKSIEERDDDILINGDPSTPEYAASFARRSRPIVSFDPQTGQPRTVTPDVSWARQPTYRGVAGGQPQAGGPPPPSTGGGQPSPKAPGQPTITGGGASPARATFEANASLAQKDIAVAQSVFFPHGIDKELNRSELVRSNLPQTPGRAAMQALERAIETILRIRSGAAIGAAEVAKYMNLYGPSVFDSDAGAATKLKRLNEFFEESKQIAAGREGASNTPPPPAEPPPQAQPQPHAVPRVPYAPGKAPHDDLLRKYGVQ